MHIDLNKQKGSLNIKDKDIINNDQEKEISKKQWESGKHNTWNKNSKGSFISRQKSLRDFMDRKIWLKKSFRMGCNHTEMENMTET